MNWTVRCFLSFFALSLAPNFVQAELHLRFERALPRESIYQERIRDGILYIQAEKAKEEGRVLRGTHAKGVCVSAEFEVMDMRSAGSELGSRLAQGVFARPQRYAAVVRFANADSGILSDHAPDVRAASLKVEMPGVNEWHRVDFLMNNAPTFPIRDANVFSSLMTIVKEGLIGAGRFLSLQELFAARAAVSLGEAQKRPADTAFQKMRYWSGVPFLHGPEEAVKYSLNPCPSNRAEPLGSGSDALMDELERNVERDLVMSCFDFQVQFLDEERMRDSNGERRPAHEWVEDASLEWPEDQSPFHTVARLTLKGASVFSDAACEAIRFDVMKHTTADHRGLGSINRVRGEAERASAARR